MLQSQGWLCIVPRQFSSDSPFSCALVYLFRSNRVNTLNRKPPTTGLWPCHQRNYWLRMVTSKSSLFDSDVQVEVKWTPPPHSTTAEWGFTDFLNHFGWFSKGSLHDSRHKLPVLQVWLLNCLGKLTSQAASGYDVVVCPPNWVQFPEPYPGATNVAVGTSLIPPL